MSGYVEFEFDLPSALLVRLIDVLDGVVPAELNITNLAQMPDEQGVYQLLYKGKIVYIGKTDGDAGLRRRLLRHSKKVVQRQNLDPKDVTFKAVRIFVFTAIDLETELIKHYGGVKNIEWNGSGFGSNDPGRERDTSKVGPGHFDYEYPIEIDRLIDFPISEGESCFGVLKRLRMDLPFTLRWQTLAKGSRKPHIDLEDSTISPIMTPVSVRDLIAHLTKCLPSGWQATAFPGYIILYKEAERHYFSGNVIAVSR